MVKIVSQNWAAFSSHKSQPKVPAIKSHDQCPMSQWHHPQMFVIHKAIKHKTPMKSLSRRNLNNNSIHVVQQLTISYTVFNPKMLLLWSKTLTHTSMYFKLCFTLDICWIAWNGIKVSNELPKVKRNVCFWIHFRLFCA